MLTETKIIQWTPMDSDLYPIPHIAVCVLNVVLKDGNRIGEPTRHRSTLYPNSDLDNIALAPGEFGPMPDGDKAAIAAWWTPERIAKYDAAIADIDGEQQ